MSINDENRRLDQPGIPTHPADPAAKGDENKVVGEQVLQTPDYNAPPSEGAIKSTGAAADPGVGGALGQPPGPARNADSLPPTGDDGVITEAHSGGDQISEELKDSPNS